MVTRPVLEKYAMKLFSTGRRLEVSTFSRSATNGISGFLECRLFPSISLLPLVK